MCRGGTEYLSRAHTDEHRGNASTDNILSSLSVQWTVVEFA